MKKIYYTNDIYTLDVIKNNFQLVKVEYIYRGHEAVIYFGFEVNENKTPNDYLKMAKHEFHKFTKTGKAGCYSCKYVLQEYKSY